MTRTRAALIHFGFSALVGLAFAAVLAFAWYPGPLFTSGGAARLASIVVTVDVVLGPLLTFVVYRAGKRGLRFDLTVIVTLQVLALAYGAHAAFVSRPVFIAVTPYSAQVMHANEIVFEPVPRPPYDRLPFSGPVTVWVPPPSDPEERAAMLDSVLSGGADVEARPAYYHYLEEADEAFWARLRPLAELISYHPEEERRVMRWLARRGAPSIDGLHYLPLFTRQGEIVMVIDPEARRSLGPLDLREPG